MNDRPASYPERWTPDADTLLRLVNHTLQLNTDGATDGQVMSYNASSGNVEWATPAGGSGAPVGSPYVLAVADVTLTGHRVLAGDGTITVTDGGATNNITVGVVDTAQPGTKGVAKFDVNDFIVGVGGNVLLSSFVVKTTTPQTLTNKTIDADLNTIIDIDADEFKDQSPGSLITWDSGSSAIILASGALNQVLTTQADGTVAWQNPSTASAPPVDGTFILVDNSSVGSMTDYRTVATGDGLQSDDAGATNAFTLKTQSQIWVRSVAGSGGVNPSGEVYTAGTIPANFLLEDFTYDVDRDFTLTLEMDAAPEVGWSPSATASYTDQFGAQNEAITWEAVQFDGVGGTPNMYVRRYRATLVLQCNATQTITITGGDGAVVTVDFTAAAVAPSVTNAVFDGVYPGAQTAVKDDDLTTWAVTIDGNCDFIDHIFNASGLADAQTFTGPFTAGTHNLTVQTASTAPNGLQETRWQCRLSSGSTGAVFVSTAQVNVDQDAPVIAAVTQSDITYPSTALPAPLDFQRAIKGPAETCTSDIIVTDFTSILYSSPNSQVTPSNTTTYEQVKTWTYAAGGYNISTNNARITATKSTNGTQTVRDFTIYIANTTPTLVVELQTGAGLPDGFQSDAAEDPKDYLIRIDATQLLVDAVLERDPTDDGIAMDPLSGSSSGDSTWNGTLRVREADTKGNYNWNRGASSYFGLNLAHQQQPNLADDNYTVAGFLARDFSRSGGTLTREFAIGTDVFGASAATLTGERVGIGSLTFFAGTQGQPVSTTPGDQPGGFTITDGAGNYDANGSHFYWLDDTQNSLALAETFRLSQEL